MLSPTAFGPVRRIVLTCLAYLTQTEALPEKLQRVTLSDFDKSPFKGLSFTWRKQDDGKLHVQEVFSRILMATPEVSFHVDCRYENASYSYFVNLSNSLSTDTVRDIDFLGVARNSGHYPEALAESNFHLESYESGIDYVQREDNVRRPCYQYFITEMDPQKKVIYVKGPSSVFYNAKKHDMVIRNVVNNRRIAIPLFVESDLNDFTSSDRGDLEKIADSQLEMASAEIDTGTDQSAAIFSDIFETKNVVRHMLHDDTDGSELCFRFYQKLVIEKVPLKASTYYWAWMGLLYAERVLMANNAWSESIRKNPVFSKSVKVSVAQNGVKMITLHTEGFHLYDDFRRLIDQDNIVRDARNLIKPVDESRQILYMGDSVGRLVAASSKSCFVMSTLMLFYYYSGGSLSIATDMLLLFLKQGYFISTPVDGVFGNTADKLKEQVTLTWDGLGVGPSVLRLQRRDIGPVDIKDGRLYVVGIDTNSNFANIEHYVLCVGKDKKLLCIFDPLGKISWNENSRIDVTDNVKRLAAPIIADFIISTERAKEG